jgi:triacylglycerol lipase
MTRSAIPTLFRCAILSLLAAFSLLSASPRAVAANDYPVVLVHGFTGWGPGELGSLNYWGGSDSIVDLLNEAGHEVHEGVVGPLASNWDRACELYAYIRGGRVDYGAAHAERYGHKRFGRTFPGLLPDWGQPGPHAMVHLVGHSQGGQTIRALAGLLARGDEAERKVSGDEVHPLFLGGHQQIRSITTLSSPHDGSTLATMLADDAGYLLNWILALASYISENYKNAPSYDFKLDQWDLSQRAGESDKAYRRRLLDSHIWDQPDISVYDLSPAGARRLNASFPAVDSIYYFSWATRDTVPGLLGGGHVPAVGMNLVLTGPSILLGRYVNKQPGPGLPAFDQSWWPNDGVVNSISMSGPKIGAIDHIINIDPSQVATTFRPGIWHFMGELKGWDHLDVVGQQTRLDSRDFYLALARMLASLPAGEQPAR